MTDNINNMSLDDEIHYCEVHTDQDTELRCNRCNRYMCIDCAVRTPVGYTCKECVRGHEDKFFEGTTADYAIVGATAFFFGSIGAFIIGMFGGFFWLTFIIAPTIGAGIGQLALSLTGRRRGRQSGYICAGGVFAGGLLVGLFAGGFGISMLIYLGMAVPAAYASMKVSI